MLKRVRTSEVCEVYTETHFSILPNTAPIPSESHAVKAVKESYCCVFVFALFSLDGIMVFFSVYCRIKTWFSLLTILFAVVAQ